MRKNKKAQEEMLGFALIIIVVAVIMLVFLSLSLRNQEKEVVESYEAESFVQAFLQYHTTCQDYSGYISLKDLIFSCNNEELCLDERDSCEVLNTTLEGILEQSWRVSPDSPVKGYELRIVAGGQELINLEKGNLTNNYKGSVQDFIKRGNLIEIFFTAYY